MRRNDTKSENEKDRKSSKGQSSSRVKDSSRRQDSKRDNHQSGAAEDSSRLDSAVGASQSKTEESPPKTPLEHLSFLKQILLSNNFKVENQLDELSLCKYLAS